MRIYKKGLLLLATAATSAAPIAAVVSCGGNGQQRTVTAKEDTRIKIAPSGALDASPYTFASVVSDPENPRWQVARSQMEAAGNELKFKSVITNIQKSPQDQVNWLTSNPANAWIIGATDDSVSSAMKNKTDGVIVAYDRLINVLQDNYNWYVSYDNLGVGRLQGTAIVNKIFGLTLPYDGTVDAAKVTSELATKGTELTEDKYVLSVAGDPSDNNAGLFFSGAKDIIAAAMASPKAANHLKWAAGADDFNKSASPKWDYGTGRARIQAEITDLKENKSKIVAVLSPNDGMAQSAVTALLSSALDPHTIYTTGLDANDFGVLQVVDGTQGMTIYKPDSVATRLAAALATELLIKPAASDDEIKNALDATYPGLKGTWVIDSTTYKVHPKMPDEKPIKTISLTPTVIEKGNVDKYFDIK